MASMVSSQITIGTTPGQLLGMLNGSGVPAGGASSKTFAAMLNGARRVVLQADPANSGDVYIGHDSSVSSTNRALILQSGSSETIEVTEYNRVDLTRWLVGSAAGQLVNVEVEFY